MEFTSQKKSCGNKQEAIRRQSNMLIYIYWQGKENIKAFRESANNNKYKCAKKKKEETIKKVVEGRYLSGREAEMCTASKIVTD